MAGTYAVDFDGSNLSSGMYFYKISVNGFSEVKKMTLIK
ncbi:MAG: T9SS type A sorting domain-containing protein [Ignavibacteria bacterium]|nr:T9SS type A sorting domain-containing protein [Ignavibacteria bacterium]MDD5363275.1 T9SS type A sorting domain-containing protein [Ignavibacteria bacterium]